MSDKPKLYLLIDNDEGLVEPILATLDEAKADKAYDDFIVENAKEADSEITYDEDDVVEINGKRYELKDQYGTPLISYFILDLE